MGETTPLPLNAYWVAARRAWRGLVVSMVLGALVFLLFRVTFSSTAFSASASVEAPTDSQLKAVPGEVGYIVEWRPSTQQDRVLLEARRRYPDAVKDKSLTVDGDDTQSRLTVTASAAQAAEAELRVISLIDWLIADRRASAEETAERLLDVDRARLAAIEERLAQLPPDADADRLILLQELLTVQEAVSGIEYLQSRDYLQQEADEPLPAEETPRGSSTTYVVLGALAGLVMGLAVVVVRRGASSMIRDEDDLASAGLAAPVVVVDAGAPDRRREQLIGLLSLLDGREPAVPRALNLAVVADSALAARLPGELAAAADQMGRRTTLVSVATTEQARAAGGSSGTDDTIVYCERALSTASDAVVVALHTDATVLVAEIGATSVSDAVAAHHLLEMAGAAPRFVVLLGAGKR